MRILDYFKPRPDINEVEQYTHDLQIMTKLRQQCIQEGNAAEAERYEQIIEGMQLVLIHLTRGVK